MSAKKLTVDRIESGIAVCFDESDVKIELKLGENTADINEGDIIEVTEEGSIVKLEKESSERKDRINRLFDKIKNRSDKK